MFPVCFQEQRTGHPNYLIGISIKVLPFEELDNYYTFE